MARKRLKPSQPYLPTRGMNKDTDSLSMALDECVHLENGRVFRDRVERRDGLDDLPDAPIAGKPFLEFHTYKTPDGGDVLFGFTGLAIYAYDEAAVAWDNVLDDDVTTGFGTTNTIDDQRSGSTAITNWSVVGFTDKTEGATMVVAGSVPPLPQDGESDQASRVLYYYDQSGSNVAGDAEYGSFKVLSQYQPTAEVLVDDVTGTPPTSYSGTTNQKPVDGSSVTVSWVSGGVIHSASDNGAGVLTANAGTTISASTFNITTGAWALDVSGGSDDVPDADTHITAVYRAQRTYMPRYLGVISNRVIMVGEAEFDYPSGSLSFVNYQPWRVRWTNVDDMKTVISDIDFQDNITGDISPYTSVLPLRDHLMLIRENSIEVMFKIGGATTFQFSTRVQNGSYAGRSWVSFQGYAYGYAKDDVYQFDGTNMKPLGIHRVRDHLADSIDFQEIRSARGFFSERDGEYFFAVLETRDTAGAQTTSNPKSIYVYNIFQDAWYYWRFAKEITAFGRYSPSAITVWGRGAGTSVAATGTITFTGPTTIADSGSGFGSFTAGMEIIVTGTTNNNKTFIIDSATAAAITTSTLLGPAVTTESPAGEVTIKSDVPAVEAGGVLAGLTGSWDSQGGSWDGASSAGLIRVPVFGFNDDENGIMSGQVSNDLGADINFDYITRDFISSDLPRKDRTQRYQFEAKGSSIDLSHSLTYGDEGDQFFGSRSREVPVNETPTALTLGGGYVEQQFWLDTTFEHIRFRMTNSASSSGLAIRWQQHFAVVREKD